MQGEQPPDNTLQVGYALTALAAQGYPLDPTTASLIHLVTSLQRADGSWLGEGVSRPPIEDSNVSTTAMAVRALTLYPLPGRAKLLHETLRKARAWLASAAANSAEERNMRLMGLVWTKAPRRDVESAMGEILRRQKPDGGWSQLDPLPTDAYATGMSLYALHEAGINVRNPVYLAALNTCSGTSMPMAPGSSRAGHTRCSSTLKLDFLLAGTSGSPPLAPAGRL